MAQNKDDAKGQNKKEKKAARNKAKKEAQYEEKKVHVKASSRAKEHDETRRVRVDDEHGSKEGKEKTEDLKNGPFKAGASGGGKQPPPKTPNWTFGGKDDEPHHEGSSGNWDQSSQSPYTGPGASRTLSDIPTSTPPNKVQDYIARRATELRKSYIEKQMSPSDAENEALDRALREGQSAGLNLSESTPSQIRDSTFFRFPKTQPGRTKSSKTEKIASQTQNAAQDIQDRFRESQNKPGGKIGQKVGQKAKQTSGTRKKLVPGETKVKKSKISNQQFLRTLSPEESDWVEKENQYGGVFHGAKGNRVPGAYRRWQQYVNARQEGYEDPENIKEWLTNDGRGKSSSVNPQRRYQQEAKEGVQSQYTKGIVRKEGIKQVDRYKSLAPSHEDFGVGIKVPGIPSEDKLRDEHPDLSDKDIFEMRESYKQNVYEEIMQNRREGHETRQAELLGRKPGDSAVNGSDRVTFFTTSTGTPAVSVAANSLVGQYIIKKRKKLLNDQKIASRAQLKGEFPYAVRDHHLVEAATGLSLGAQGRYGAFKHVGYRAGSKKSKGYGKMLPVGSQILRDSSGQPIYDRNGNVRYSEGFTRPFDIRPSNEVGLRVYLG